MTIEEIVVNLCVYDKRNPDSLDEGKNPKKCCCDNCFYGRDILAQEILRLMQEDTSEQDEGK